jgi:ribosome maturation factor RimP
MHAQNQALYALLDPVVADLGYELWGVEQVSAPGRTLLRIYIDSPAGISVDDCARVSRRVAGVLDVEDPIRGPYDLEVSSPGLDRPLFTLAQCERYVGRQVRLRLRAKLRGQRRIAGIIERVSGDSLELAAGADRYVVPADMIEQLRLVPEV